jgi:predicted esterase
MPYKDSLFQHGSVLQNSGNYFLIDYNEMRDVNGRDSVPVERARGERVTLLQSSLERSDRIETLRTYIAGFPEDADFAVVFIHGAGGNRELGFNDWSFGGNFNRLKNLAVMNNGAYISPSVRFNTAAMNSVGDLIEHLKASNPSLKIILSCASQGGSVCWHLAANSSVSNKLSGMVFLGTAVNMPSLNLAYISERKPIVFAHGSLDPILPVGALYNSYLSLRNNNSYPVRFYSYNGGIHGTPIRMIDWRETLNWILNQ